MTEISKHTKTNSFMLHKIKICFYCDSIFSFGGVQKILALISNSLSEKYEIP